MVWIISRIYSIYFRVTCYFFWRPKSKKQAILSQRNHFPNPQGFGGNKTFVTPKPMKSPCRLSQPGKICFEKMCVRTRTSCLEKCLGFTKWFYLQVGYTKNNLIASLLGGESDFFSVRKTRENWDKSTKSRDHLKNPQSFSKLF